MKPGRKKKWTKPYIVSAIRARKKAGKSLRFRYVFHEIQSLVVTAQREFGSWRTAVECAGFDYDEILQVGKAGARPRQRRGGSHRWTREYVLRCIYDRRKHGKPLNVTAVQRDYPTLYTSAQRIFGSWREAIRAAGISYHDIKRTLRWDRAEVQREVWNRLRTGKSLSSRAVNRDSPKLFSAAQRHFGSWGQAIEASGLAYQEIRKYRRWNKRKILAHIRQLVQDDAAVNVGEIQASAHYLYGIACYRFGSWEKAVEAAGFAYKDVCLHFRTQDLLRHLFGSGDHVRTLQEYASRRKARQKK